MNLTESNNNFKDLKMLIDNFHSSKINNFRRLYFAWT